MQSIKVNHNNEVRRLQVPSNSSFKTVQDSIRNAFTGLNSASFSLVWTDDEGDKVTVSSDPELAEAIRVLSGQKVMARFDIVLSAREAVPEVAVHFNVSCDECGVSPILGDRFKCTVRNDFDLCAKCEASRVQPFPMIKMSANRTRPEGCHAFRGMNGGGRGFHGGRGFPAGGRGVPGGRGAVHRHIRCDDCGVSPIVGNRFKCTYREDFDLCEGCEAKKVQPYPMVKIADPTHAPVALVYAFNEDQQPHPHAHNGPGHLHAHGPHGHPHGPHGLGHGHHERFANCGRGVGGRGGFRCGGMGRGGPHGRGGGFGCPMFNKAPESGPLAGVDLTPEGFAALGRLSGYHNLGFPQAGFAANFKSSEPEPSSSSEPTDGKQSKKSATGEASTPVAEPVTVEALKAINPPLTSLIESFLFPITTPEQRAAGEKHLNEVLKAVANSDGLPAGVYPFPQRDGQCGRRNHHHHFEERRQRRLYEQTTRDLNDEDAELQRALSECFTPSAAEETPATTTSAPSTSEVTEDEDVEDVVMPSAATSEETVVASDGNESDSDSVVLVDTPVAATPTVEVVSAPPAPPAPVAAAPTPPAPVAAAPPAVVSVPPFLY